MVSWKQREDVSFSVFCTGRWSLLPLLSVGNRFLLQLSDTRCGKSLCPPLPLFLLLPDALLILLMTMSPGKSWGPLTFALHVVKEQKRSRDGRRRFLLHGYGGSLAEPSLTAYSLRPSIAS